MQNSFKIVLTTYQFTGLVTFAAFFTAMIFLILSAKQCNGDVFASVKDQTVSFKFIALSLGISIPCSGLFGYILSRLF